MESTLAAIVLALMASTPSLVQTGSQGSQWTFVAIDGAKPVSDKAVLSIDSARIGANVGCNGLGADLVIEPSRLKVGPVVSTMMYCDGLMQQEEAVKDLLAASPAYFIEGDRLYLHTSGHSAELVKR